MRWRDGRRSDNVEDTRGLGGGGGFGGGGLKLGIGGLVVAAAAYFLGVDPQLIMGIMQATQGDGSSLQSGPAVQTARPTDETGDFMSVVLADTEDTWTELFRAAGRQYTPPRLRIYDAGQPSGCGSTNREMGPFYCPADHRVYIDPAFFSELERRFGAPGDFARAYVLAHEVGHHVQMLTGISDKVRAAQQRGSQEQQNALQVRMELQADCYAGIWAHYARASRNLLESGDLEEALGAAAAVGDDMIQKRAQGYMVPESFTHGTAAQRQQWFRRGFDSGQMEACDTFAAKQ